ncbi:TIGR00266 family protein [bacterium]|nr:TIGR00266 family protein [bacterium]
MWYLAIGGKQQGPMGAEDIINKLRTGDINGETLAYASEVTQTWTPINQISQFVGVTLNGSRVPDIPEVPRGQLADEIDYRIFGDDLQFVEIELDPNESVIAEAGAMMYMDEKISMDTIFGDGAKKQEDGFWGALKSAGKRIITGESLFMTVFTNTVPEGKSSVAFGAPYPGKIIVVDLREVGGTLLCQKEAFLCGAKGVSIGIAFQKRFGVGLFGGEGFIMQKLEGDGLVFCHAGGTIISKELAPNQVLKVDTGCIVAYQPSVDFDIEMAKNVKTALFGGEGLFFATLKGPGRVWLQSLPFSRLASRIYSAARQTGGGGKDEGSVLGGVFNLISGDK